METKPRAGETSGFSLMELLLVLSVIVVVTAIATPTIVRTVRRYQTESSARNVASILLRTRTEAVKRNQRISTIFVAPSGTNGAFYGIDLNGNGALDPTEPRVMAAPGMTFWQNNTPTVPPTTGLPADYTSLAAPATPSGGPTAYSVTFSPQGTVVVNNGGQWQLASQTLGICVTNGNALGAGNSDSWLITITPTAHLRVFYWQSGGWSAT